ncbi:MAG: O-antigen ligase family protein [Thermodesulfobacteriota bacterium]
MNIDSRIKWASRLDKFCAVTGSLVPAGLVIGNIGFEAAIGIVGLAWITRCIVIKENPFRELWQHPLVIPWAAWFAGMVISMVFNGPGSKGWAHDVVFIRYVLFGLALLDISRRLPVARYLLYGLAAGVLWAALNTLSAYVLGRDLLGKPLLRYTGKLKEASRISGMSAYAAALFICWGMLDGRLNRRQRSVVMLAGMIAFAQVLQTQVRTAILGAAAGIFFGAACLINKKQKRGLALALVLAVVLTIAAVFYINRQFTLSSIYDRIYFWKVAWRMWLDHPVLGVGISSFQDVYKEMAASGVIAEYVAPDGSVFSAGEQTHAHSLFFMLLSSTGLLGLIVFFWLFITAVRVIVKDLKGFRYGLVSWPVVLIVIGLTGFNIYHSWYQALLAFMLILIGAADDGNASVGRHNRYGR